MKLTNHQSQKSKNSRRQYTEWFSVTAEQGGSREEDLNPGPPDYKSSALPLGHARLPIEGPYAKHDGNGNENVNKQKP